MASPLSPPMPPPSPPSPLSPPSPPPMSPPPPPPPPPPPWWSNTVHVPSDLTFSLSLYAALAVVVVSAFCALWPYATVHRARPGADPPTGRSRLLRAFDRLFAWAYPIFGTGADDFIAAAGLDAYMFSRVMQFGVEVFGFTSLVCLSLVIPTNLAGNVVSRNHVKRTGNANDFTRYTMGNIENGSDLFYVHFVAVYLIVLWTLFCMRRLFREYIVLRRRFLSKVNGLYSPSARRRGAAVHPAPRADEGGDPNRRGGAAPCEPEEEEEDDALFYDDCVVVDRATGDEVVISNVHRYVVLLRHVPSVGRGARGAGPPPLAARARAALRSLAALFLIDMGGHGGIGRRESLLGPASEDEDESDGDGEEGAAPKGDALAAEVAAVRRKLERVFPGDSVAEVVPVYDGRRADELMMERHRLRARLRSSARRAGDAYGNLGEDVGDSEPRRCLAARIACCRPAAADARACAERIDALTRRIHLERAAARSRASGSYFVIFREQRAAMMARQMLLFENATLGSKFSVEPAPAPTDVIYDSIVGAERPGRGARAAVSGALVGALVALPVGALASGISTLSVLLCSQYQNHHDGGGAPTPVFSHSAAEMWCVDLPADARAFVTGIVPSLIISAYGGHLLPSALYCLALCEGLAVHKAAVDERIASWYWVWAVVNVFFSSLAGGSVFSQVNVALVHPEAIPRLIGTAIPKFSNFFINYVSFQALVSNGLMLLLPSAAGLLRFPCSAPGARARAPAPRQSVRYGRECGITMLVFLICISYAVQSPLIAPAALAYFVGVWAVWRHLVLFVYIRSYESCGEMVFTYTRRAVFHSLKIMITLMALLFLIYTRWSLGVLLLVTLLPAVHAAGEGMQRRLGRLADDGVPLETIVRHGEGNSPTVQVPGELYVHPALREGVWGANQGMAWVNWGWIPRHAPA